MRFVLLATLVVAAVLKLRDPSGFRKSLRELGVTGAAGSFLAPAVPSVELSAAVLLAIPATARAGATLTASMLIAFSLTLALAVRRGGGQVTCGCFGPNGRSVSWRTFLRNGALLAVAALAWQTAPPTPITTAIVPFCTTFVVSLAVGLAMRPLTQRRSINEHQTFPFGASGDVTDPDLAPVLLVFLSVRCGPCQALIPDLIKWHDALGHRIDIRIVANGATNELQPIMSAFGSEHVLLHGQDDLAAAYGVTATPSAVLLASSVAPPQVGVGAHEIAALVAPFERPIARDQPFATSRMSRRRVLGYAASIAGAAVLVPELAAAAAVAATCTSNAQCAVGELCVGGTCQPEGIGGQCGSGTDNTCPFGYVCANGTCVPPPATGCSPSDPSTCATGQVCLCANPSDPTTCECVNPCSSACPPGTTCNPKSSTCDASAPRSPDVTGVFWQNGALIVLYKTRRALECVVHSSKQFSTATIVPSSVRLAVDGVKTRPTRWRRRAVKGAGPDLVLWFPIPRTGINCKTRVATVRGHTTKQASFATRVELVPWPCKY